MTHTPETVQNADAELTQARIWLRKQEKALREASIGVEEGRRRLGNAIENLLEAAAESGNVQDCLYALGQTHAPYRYTHGWDQCEKTVLDTLADILPETTDHTSVQLVGCLEPENTVFIEIDQINITDAEQAKAWANVWWEIYDRLAGAQNIGDSLSLELEYDEWLVLNRTHKTAQKQWFDAGTETIRTDPETTIEEALLQMM